MSVDLEPAAERMTTLIARVSDELLTAPAPCPSYPLADLLDHVYGMAFAFTGAATKIAEGSICQGRWPQSSRSRSS